MSNQQINQNNEDVKSKLILNITVVFSIIAVLGTVVFLLLTLVGHFKPLWGSEASTNERTEELVNSRIAPITKVNIGQITATVSKQSAEQIFESLCKSCHTVEGTGAPLVTNQEDWKKRAEQGYETLAKHAIGGFNGMPARGGNPKLSDEEVKDALDYMLNKVGIEVPRK